MPNRGRSRLLITPIVYKSLLASLLFLCIPESMAADLPALIGARSSSGQTTSAIFRAGATTGATNFRTEFLASDVISIAAQIEVEAAHVNKSGNLYVLIDLDGRIFMRNASGAYQIWNREPATLLPATLNTPLQASMVLPIVSNTALGARGLAGSTLSLYLAYNLNSAPQQLYYSSSPLQIRIDRYDPLLVAGNSKQPLATTMLDSKRNRVLPLLIFLPSNLAPAPVILFSHGLGGTYETAVYLGEHWSARGYVVAFMQHPGSDGNILAGVPASQVLSVMQAAASAENLVARIGDVSAVIDCLEAWNKDAEHVLYQRLDLAHIGMSGHSFGARTTQTTSGETVPWLNYPTRDPRIKAAIPLSASVTDINTAKQLLGSVDLPWLVMTGTLDTSVVNDTTVADRLAVFPALPPGNKYELVFFEGEHHAFTDRPISPLQKPRNPAHHPAIQAISTAFWDGYLRGDVSARQWLEQTARSVLTAADSWQFK